MAVIITFTGNIYNTNKIQFSGSEVSYQVYFHDSDSVGSPSTWSNTRTSSFGQYNFNLADSDLLGTTGNVGDGDQVVIVFWLSGSDRNASCSTLTEWCAFEIVLGTGPGMNPGGDSYVNDVQLKFNIAPDLHWTFPTVGGTHYVNETYSANNTSEDVHSWTLSGTSYSDPPIDMYHWRTRYGENIQLINTVSGTDYDWNDGNQTLGLIGAAGSNHQWSMPGVYNVEVVIYDECSATATGTEQITIYWHPPTCGITMYPSNPDPNDVIYFKYTGSDVDNTIDYIEWIINDGATTTTTSGSSGDSIYHTEGLGTAWCGTSASGGAFTNSGNHLVEITLHWNDGFDDQTTDCDDTFTQSLFTGPTVDFTQVPSLAVPGSGVKFINSSTNTSRVGLGLPDCDEYEWTWTEDGVPTIYSDKPESYELEVIPNSVDSKVKLCVDWSDGFDTQTTCTEKNIVFQTSVTISEVECYYNLNVIGTSDDGTVSGYSWTIASGTSSIGPWTDIWETPDPPSMYQNDKKICFTSTGWYKATGYVYGTGATTSDDEIVYITEVCPTTVISGTEVIPVCGPNFHGYAWGKLDRTGHEVKPTMRAKVDVIPSGRVINTYPLPRNL